MLLWGGKNDKSIYKKYNVIDVNLDEVDEILKDYITTHNKKFNIYFINCEFKLEFDKNFTTNIETKYFFKIEVHYIKSCLLYYIDSFSSKGCIFHNLKQMTINSIHDRCNITYSEYLKLPLNAVERKINMIIAKKPQLINVLERNKNHPLIGKNSHRSFNN